MPARPTLSSRTVAALATSAFLALAASAQTEPGNLLITYSASSNDSTFTEYDADGNVVNQVTALTFDSFTSGALGPANEIIINREYGSRIEVRAPDGTLVHDFFPAEAIGQAWDMDLFADGTIALCARGVGIVLYDQGGNYLDTFAPAGIDYPFGCQVAIDDTLWDEHSCRYEIIRHRFIEKLLDAETVACQHARHSRVEGRPVWKPSGEISQRPPHISTARFPVYVVLKLGHQSFSLV